jgi:lipid A disaccharide synthetase
MPDATKQSERETKTIAECTVDELIDELAARSEASAIGVAIHAEPGTFRTVYSGSLIAAMGLTEHLRDIVRAALMRVPERESD